MKIEIDVYEVIFTLINFAILYFILRHFLFKPINNVLTARRNEIDSDIKEADENKVRAEEYRIESETNLRESKSRGKSLVEDYKRKAEKLSDEIVSDANKEAQEIINRAVKEAEREKQKAQSEIQQQVVELAVLLSAKALEKSINEEEHRRLINDFITKVGI